jgi:hypothetical protein
MHEARARQEEEDDEASRMLMPSLRTANPPLASQASMTSPQGTDVAALLREVLEGFRSYLANSEWRFPAITLTPTVALGSGKNARPECSSMGKLRDVVLAGVRDLLMEYSHKVRRCAGPDCDRAFLSVRRQKFCSKACAWQVRYERFKRNLGGEEGFSERRHRYYEDEQRRKTGNPKLRVPRRVPKGTGKQK